MLAATSWVSSPTTISVVSALAAVAGTLIAAWALVLAGPRYRLSYGPLASLWDQDGESWRVTIWLSSRGRRDITRDAFDDGKPIELDIGVRICGELVSVWSSQENVRIVESPG
jgi:hypothetical protein